MIEAIANLAQRLHQIDDEWVLLQTLAASAQLVVPDGNGTICRFSPKQDVAQALFAWNSTGLVSSDSDQVDDQNKLASLLQQAKLADAKVYRLSTGDDNIIELRLWSVAAGALSTELHRTFEACALICTQALEKISLQQKLNKQSVRDALTGLYNRRYLQDTLERELDRAKRFKHPSSLILYEADGHTQFVDSLGAEAGNKLLIAIAGILQGTFRGYDVSCRFSNNRFMQILPEAAISDARMRAEEVANWVRELDVQFRGTPLPSTSVSIGIASFPNHADSGEKLILAAESALFMAKESGHGEIAIAEKVVSQ